MMGRFLIIATLLVSNLAAAVNVVDVKNQTRDYRDQLQKAWVELDELEMVWAQLRLEESAITNYDYIKQQAKRRLNMVQPKEYTVLRAGGL